MCKIGSWFMFCVKKYIFLGFDSSSKTLDNTLNVVVVFKLYGFVKKKKRKNKMTSFAFGESNFLQSIPVLVQKNR